MSDDVAQASAVGAFQAYLREIARNLEAGTATEHTHRPALQALIQELDPGVRAVNEPKRVACGAPDYIVTRNELPVGYVEAKDVGRSLDEIERDKQLKRYRESLSNLILTDYLEFRWYRDGAKQQAARIADVRDSDKLRPDREGQKQAAMLFSSFLAQEPPIVATPEELAERMAALARTIRDTIAKALEQDRSGGSPLHEQLAAFRNVLIHDLSDTQFADMYAQTIAYGFFAARVNAPADERFSRRNAAYDLPKTNPFLRQMFGHIAGPDLDERITWVVDDLSELLARARMDRVLKDFGKRTRQQDPVVHFYETFLKAYDPKMREARGVYYTPEPVVSYIVRSVNHILKTEFGLKDGLADNTILELPTADGKGTRQMHKVQILDPATGTGTFLAQVVETVYENFAANRGMWPGYVHNHLLPRLHGFELLMAPYAIAHLKLGLRLKETGYDIDQSERLGVYLTNSLEAAHELGQGQLSWFGMWLVEEAVRASEIKGDVPLMVVLGNPPYSGISANKSKSLHWLVDAYRSVDGQPLGERKLWLQDDYVKFIRLAQLQIELTGFGVVAYVTNHGFLDNPTFRGMRRSLMRTFDEILLLNLHGNTKKREASPDGSTDENVFDIQQGVTISLMVRHESKAADREATVRYADMWGDRASKYTRLMDLDVRSTPFVTLEPKAPAYWFVPRDNEFEDEYLKFPALPDLMPMHSVGIVCARDALAVAFTPDEIWERVNRFVSLEEEDARSQFQLGADVRDWKVKLAQADLQAQPLDPSLVHPILYRPFDVRFTYYTGRARGFIGQPAKTVMQHLISGQNLALATTRSVEIGRGWEHVFCTRRLMQHHAVSNKEVNYVFPLHLLGYSSQQTSSSDNLSRYVLDWLSFLQLGETSRMERSRAAFDYMYALLHSPTYRRRYAQFLRSDFPRIPLTSDLGLFRELCRLGGRLVSLHLMEADAVPLANYPVPGDNRVEKVQYMGPEQGIKRNRVWINDTQYFEGVAPEVWESYVGGHRVCAKWLQDRKGRLLTYDDLTNYRYVVAALAETIALVQKIDEIIEEHGGWPIA